MVYCGLSTVHYGSIKEDTSGQIVPGENGLEDEVREDGYVWNVFMGGSSG